MKSLLVTIVSLLALSCGSIATSAKETVMYKKIDKDGNVVFTDKPIPGSKPITVKTDVNVVSTPKPAYKAPTISDSSEEDDDEKKFKYEVLAIDTPKNDEGIRANDGRINVIVAVTPNLRPNHSVQLKLDGNNVGQAQKIPYFNLTEVERGTHQLQAMIIDDDSGETVQSSDAISFHALIASRLNQNRRKKR
ncbi:DUF4124 domain-containing protein [Kangiella spongicola]|uniref:DUF4124 domain-containing protein n=1 Tax=Kangiella spongicola TaxID=796379 RepID=A0A318DAP4_9GAMM|nr:DUF4124 domain-containing protein [Kangiella spongicola]PXF64007.1 DUF4124 domain-containing protein [Kangiella spongicola]